MIGSIDGEVQFDRFSIRPHQRMSELETACGGFLEKKPFFRSIGGFESAALGENEADSFLFDLEAIANPDNRVVGTIFCHLGQSCVDDSERVRFQTGLLVRDLGELREFSWGTVSQKRDESSGITWIVLIYSDLGEVTLKPPPELLNLFEHSAP